SFWAGNPFATTAKMEVRVVLPPFLATRGWAVNLDNPGGGSFSLGPRDSREIRPRLISGQDFNELQLQAAGRVTIQFIVLADGLVVGGVTYLLDPKLKEPPCEKIEEEHHKHHEHERRCKYIKCCEHVKCCEHEECLKRDRCCEHERC